jgi:endonuclease YncB( thermonuclease family)
MALVGAGAQAQAPPTASLALAACAGAAGSAGVAGELASVIDGRSFRLTDGREVRLAGVEAPSVDDGDGIDAKAALEALTLTHTMTLRPAAPAPDRYGRLIAYVSVAAPERLLQQEMLAGGHVLLSPVGLASACRTLLRATERAARAARLGLWADLRGGVQQASEPADVLSRQGRFALVSGKVLSVRDSGGIVYVNFGRRWSDDFTITILKRNERTFSSVGLTPAKLVGHRIEVRGWIEERNGPAIEVVRPEQIELVD